MGNKDTEPNKINTVDSGTDESIPDRARLEQQPDADLVELERRKYRTSTQIEKEEGPQADDY